MLVGDVCYDMFGMLDGYGDCCVGMYCRCWLGGCWLFVLLFVLLVVVW